MFTAATPSRQRRERRSHRGHSGRYGPRTVSKGSAAPVTPESRSARLRRCLEGLKTGTSRSGTSTRSPVLGLRSVRALRCCTLKVPKPQSSMWPPRTRRVLHSVKERRRPPDRAPSWCLAVRPHRRPAPPPWPWTSSGCPADAGGIPPRADEPAGRALDDGEHRVLRGCPRRGVQGAGVRRRVPAVDIRPSATRP